MAKERDNNSITSRKQLEMTGVSKSIVKPQNIDFTNLETPEEQAEKRHISLSKI